MPITHLATDRGRPDTIRVYATPITETASPASGRDGIEYPCQPVRIVMPSGRGRAMMIDAL